MVEITAEEFKQLMDLQKTMAKQITDLQNGIASQEGTTRTLKRITDRVVEVRTIDDKVVVGYRNRGSDNRPVYIYDKADPKDPTQRLLYVDLILEGMKPEEAITINYKEFRAESNRVKCVVKHKEEREWLINQGTVKKREVDEYTTVDLDYEVPLDVVGKTTILTVALPAEFGGREVKIHENYVNIA